MARNGYFIQKTNYSYCINDPNECLSTFAKLLLTQCTKSPSNYCIEFICINKSFILDTIKYDVNFK